MTIKVLEFTSPVFNRFFNLGDDIQSLAVSRLLPAVDGYVCRESLDTVTTPCTVPMNGFFMNTDHWPPAAPVIPVFFAFHVQPSVEKVVFSPAGIEYLKRWQPIGCRDQGTLALMQKYGIDAFYSRCVTLTLPKRERAPEQGEVFLVGVKEAAQHVLPRALRKEAVVVDQAKVRLPITDTALKLALAENLLSAYRDRARLVITSKIHCAMPCIAMGIPVIFLYDTAKQDDYRVKIINDLVGIHYVHMQGPFARLRNKALTNDIDWSPQPLDIEPLKEDIRSRFVESFERARSLADKAARG